MDINDNSPKEIVDNFVYSQEILYGNNVNKTQRKNMSTLANLLYYPNQDDINVPIVANIPMGEGKSSLLIEFMKYLCAKDPGFGAVVVKKTLEECHDFCIEMGLKNKEYEFEVFGNDKQKLTDAYYNSTSGEQLKLYNTINQSDFIARTVRGFNFTDCVKYGKKTKEEITENISYDLVDYDYRLCRGCDMKCSAKMSKVECRKHGILAISHTRLFLSNYINEFCDDIMYFNLNGEKAKRRLLIIDEKIDMCDIPSITDSDFEKLREIVFEKFSQYGMLFNEIYEYINCLEYQEEMNKPVKEQTKLFRNGIGFEFEEELLEAFYEDTSIDRKIYENLLNLGRILNSKNITTGIPYRFADSKARADKENRKLTREIFAHKYLDLAAYNNKFDKTLILDATANLDYDYDKSNVIGCDDIINEKREINVYIPYRDANTSKSSLLSAGNHKMKAMERTSSYMDNIKNLVLECKQIMETCNKKTLIVVYKEIIINKTYEFKKDFINELENEYDEGNYEIIHHGEFTTGVNKFSDCERLIIIGQLNKSSSFYQNKCLAVGRKIEEDDTDVQHISNTALNDYLISNIQQIGRTAYRNEKVVDVYFLARKEVIEILLTELDKYFLSTKNTFKNTYYYKDLTKQELLIEKILVTFKGLKKGEIIKSRISKRCAMK